MINALQQAQGNQSKASKILGISRTSVWSQMKKFNVRTQDYSK
ncbi:helix-turn-helix domain-containing protein [Desulfonema limicola]